MKQAREFCLQVIREVYGYKYRPDWHADLDSLLKDNGIYSEDQNGYFVTQLGKNDQIIGVGGLRHLSTHAACWHRFGSRYQTDKVGALWRVYVDAHARGAGIGSYIVKELEQKARELDYQYLYLHTSHHNPNAVRFWERQGFQTFATDGNDDLTVHMEKVL